MGTLYTWSHAYLGICFAAAAAGCAHRTHNTARDATRGRCPTEVRQASIAVVEGGKLIDVRIMTRPGGDALAIQNSAEEIAAKLLQMHPAKPPGVGEPIQHVAVKDVRISSIPNGAVLIFEAQDDDGLKRLRSRIDDHVRRWRLGECPILANN